MCERFAPMPNVANLIFDLGSHNGQDSDFYLKKGFTVVAVEAIRRYAIP
jgi:hypothetical protein